MTTLEQTSAVTESDTEQYHLYVPPQVLAEAIGRLAVEDKQTIKLELSAQATQLHDAALRTSLKIEGPVTIPTTLTWPGIVSQEVVSLNAVARRNAGRGLVPHPTDPMYHLIVPR